MTLKRICIFPLDLLNLAYKLPYALSSFNMHIISWPIDFNLHFNTTLQSKQLPALLSITSISFCEQLYRWLVCTFEATSDGPNFSKLNGKINLTSYYFSKMEPSSQIHIHYHYFHKVRNQCSAVKCSRWLIWDHLDIHHKRSRPFFLAISSNNNFSQFLSPLPTFYCKHNYAISCSLHSSSIPLDSPLIKLGKHVLLFWGSSCLLSEKFPVLLSNTISLPWILSQRLHIFFESMLYNGSFLTPFNHRFPFLLRLDAFKRMNIKPGGVQNLQWPCQNRLSATLPTCGDILKFLK